jgi:hypothetical protein
VAEVDWNQLKMEYLEGGTSYTRLADKYGLTRDAIAKHAQRDGWQALKKARYAETEREMVRRAAAQEVDRTERVWTAADLLLDRVVALMSGSTGNTARDLRDLSAALRDVRETLGLKTQRDIREQEAKIAKLEADARKDDGSDKVIRVVMDGSLDDFAQ